MDNNNYNSNSNSDSNNEYPSNSLYSYNYIEQEKKAEDSYGYNEVQNATAAQGTYHSSGTEEHNRWSPYDTPKKKEKKPKEGKRGFGITLVKCAALALVFGLVSGTVFQGVGYVFRYATGNSGEPVAEQQMLPVSNEDAIPTATTVNTKVVSDVSGVVDGAMSSIVAITSLSQVQYQDWFGRVYNEEAEGAGSGIIIAQTDGELYIVTNNHVVSGGSSLTVCFDDGETVAAEIKGTDPSSDLAVISISVDSVPAETLSKIKVATLGNSDNLKVGEGAIAIGNALGYGQSVTTGVISAMNREVTVEDSMTGESITNELIQTDAAINPGNSGGALLNMNGEVIGINSVKFAAAEVEGMGYAIPINMAEPIINELITREAVAEAEKAYLGIGGADVTEDIALTYDFPKGVYVTQVMEGSAAAKAGIRKGDVITSFDGREVTSMEALSERMQYYAAGTVVDVTIMTPEDGEYIEKTVSVTLGKKR